MRRMDAGLPAARGRAVALLCCCRAVRSTHTGGGQHSWSRDGRG
jgi:hypothetical protein